MTREVDSIASKEEQEKTLTEDIDDLSEEIKNLQKAAVDAKKVRDDTAGVYHAWCCIRRRH